MEATLKTPSAKSVSMQVAFLGAKDLLTCLCNNQRNSSWSSSTSATGTNRNSASRSMNVRMSQGQATRSTFTLARVTHFIGASQRSRDDYVADWARAI